MGGAELAAFRGDAATVRELWALGMRVDANASRLFRRVTANGSRSHWVAGRAASRCSPRLAG